MRLLSGVSVKIPDNIEILYRNTKATSLLVVRVAVKKETLL